MAVRIRLTRLGRKNHSYFRIGAFDNRTRREGRAIELLGTYDPHQAEEDKKVTLKVERIKHWLSVGALPSETVSHLLRKAKVLG